MEGNQTYLVKLLNGGPSDLPGHLGAGRYLMSCFAFETVGGMHRFIHGFHTDEIASARVEECRRIGKDEALRLCGSTRTPRPRCKGVFPACSMHVCQPATPPADERPCVERTHLGKPCGPWCELREPAHEPAGAVTAVECGGCGFEMEWCEPELTTCPGCGEQTEWIPARPGHVRALRAVAEDLVARLGQRNDRVRDLEAALARALEPLTEAEIFGTLSGHILSDSCGDQLTVTYAKLRRWAGAIVAQQRAKLRLAPKSEAQRAEEKDQ